MKKVLTVVVIALTAYFQAQGQDSNSATDSDKSSKLAAQPAPAPDPCPACAFSLQNGDGDNWRIDVTGSLTIGYFEAYHIVSLQSPVLRVYIDTDEIGSFNLMEEYVSIYQSWANGHYVSGNGKLEKKPNRATITWMQTDSENRTSSVTQEITLQY